MRTSGRRELDGVGALRSHQTERNNLGAGRNQVHLSVAKIVGQEIHSRRSHSTLVQLVCFQSQSSRIVHLLSEEVRPDVNRKTSEKQTSEDEVRLVVVRKKGEHPIHQVRRLLVPGEREGNQSFKPLIVIQRVQLDEASAENLVGFY